MAGGLSKFLSKILGGAPGAAGSGEDSAKPAAETYNGYTIRPAPFKDGAQWITSGVIEKPFPDGLKEHRFVRADMYPAREAAVAASVFKAKQMIDMMGDDVFATASD